MVWKCDSLSYLLYLSQLQKISALLWNNLIGHSLVKHFLHVGFHSEVFFTLNIEIHVLEM